MRERTETAEKMARIRAIVSDIDGCLTDGSIFYGPEGDCLKVFHVHDNLGLQMVRAIGWPVAVITARHSPMVERWAAEQQIDKVFQGATSKVPCLDECLAEWQLPAEAVAYLGDDIWDLAAMARCGLTATPADAVLAARERADVVLGRNGGRGAMRELIDRILEVQNRTREAWDAWYATKGVRETASFLGPADAGGERIGFRHTS